MPFCMEALRKRVARYIREAADKIELGKYAIERMK